MTQNRRSFLAILIAGLAAAPAFPGGASGQQKKKPRAIAIEIRKRKVVSPKGRIRIYENETVELHWSTDETVKLHLHGYDIEFLVEPGKTAVMPFTGKATGRFPVTSHGWGTGGHGHHALSYLEVYPR
jgi:hypothetical protein